MIHEQDPITSAALEQGGPEQISPSDDGNM